MRLLSVCCLALSISLATFTGSRAAIITNNWTLDFSVIHSSLGQVTGIDQIGFTGIAHAHVFDNGNNVPEPGETFQIDSLFRATSFIGPASNDDSKGNTLNGGSATDFEIEFDLSNGGIFTSASGQNINFTHTAGGLLNVRVDIPHDINLDLGVGGNSVSNFNNGTFAAQFQMLAGDGGVLDLANLDGSDDGMFELVNAVPGFILDSGGNDIGQPGLLLAITDSNFDLDTDNNGNIDSGPPTGWPFGFTGAGTPVDFFASEDGSASLAIVPEPTAFLVWGVGIALGVFGIGTVRRRKTYGGIN